MNGEINREKIRNVLFSLQDEKYREFSSKLSPGEETIIGVRTPALRKYANELYKEHVIKQGVDLNVLLEEIGDDCYEEIILQGMLIGLQKKVDKDRLFKQIDEFVPKIKNWAVCDAFCGGLKETKKFREDTYDFLQKYLDSDEEYAIRFGLVMLLDYYIDEEYIDRILAKTEEITHEAYYVKMAAAWLVSICFVKLYDRTKAFMENCKLDDFTYNKALQKARESYRITPEQKEELKLMKRKVVK